MGGMQGVYHGRHAGCVPWGSMLGVYHGSMLGVYHGGMLGAIYQGGMLGAIYQGGYARGIPTREAMLEGYLPPWVCTRLCTTLYMHPLYHPGYTSRTPAQRTRHDAQTC